MKKSLSILMALVLMLSAIAFAAPVASKTSTDLTTVATTTDAEGNPIDPVVTVGQDTVMATEEVDGLIEFAAENDSIIEYYPGDTQDAILATLQETYPELTAEDLEDWTLNEIFSVDVTDYDPENGDVTVGFEFATPYEVGQKIVALLGTYDGTRTEVAPNEFAFNVNYLPLQAEVVDSTTVDGETKSTVEVTFTAEALTAMQESVANTIAILSEPTED